MNQLFDFVCIIYFQSITNCEVGCNIVIILNLEFILCLQNYRLYLMTIPYAIAYQVVHRCVQMVRQRWLRPIPVTYRRGKLLNTSIHKHDYTGNYLK